MGDSKVFILVILMASLIIFFLVYFIMKSMNKSTPRKVKKQKKGSNMVTNNVIAEYLPNFDRDRFNRDIFNTFVYVQEAMNNYDLEYMKNHLSVELFQVYNSRIQTNRQNGRTMIRNEFEHFYTRIDGITRVGGTVEVNVMLGVEFKEYFLDSSNQILAGNVNIPKYREFNLIVMVKNNDRAVISCSHCGAMVADRVSSRCRYCEKPLISYDYEIVLLKERSREIKKPKFFTNKD